MGDSGKVMLLPRGEYYSATPYEELDCVYYQGRSYVCKQASTGHAPTDTTYWQPMTPDASAEIQALTNYDANNGVKNIWNINAIGTESQSGITYTPSEGVLKLTGTALNASVWPTTVTSAEKSYTLKPNTTYKISVGVTFSNSIKLGIYVKATESSAWDNVLTADSGTEATYTTPATWAQIWIRVEIASGYTLPAALYPMIREATITDPTYQPYAKTNMELTAESAGADYTDQSLFTNIDATAIARPHFEVYKRGNAIYGVFSFDIIRTVTNGEVLFKTPVAPKTDTFFCGTGVGTSDVVKGFVWKNNGNVCSYGSNTAEDYIASNVSTFIS